MLKSSMPTSIASSRKRDDDDDDAACMHFLIPTHFRRNACVHAYEAMATAVRNFYSRAKAAIPAKPMAAAPATSRWDPEPALELVAGEEDEVEEPEPDPEEDVLEPEPEEDVELEPEPEPVDVD